ncbi:hypothetical protein SEA_PAOLA_88 [Mycobacterium phage Paola]|uniref:Uncharacterized protein n=1 Tax=Mycobacterium phage Paola TaxID=2094139 RepID=A0A2P1K039_9CAUD|nr:hypothetical protein I5G74_gp09 [Mycobacterium phage Paola]ASR85876.1 hypothetical protein SEA_GUILLSMINGER_89 [Mycobacterium phage Guillsminger]AVO25874.1 hypothetical protein SEA_PAOLA_88 [Mycobacterium phage Paola]
MFKMIVQLHRRTEVTEHATIADARARLNRICSAAGVRIEGNNATGELIALTRNGYDNPLVNWNYGAYLITEVDPAALVHVVEHVDGVERFPSEAAARHFQSTIAPGSSRYTEQAGTPADSDDDAPRSHCTVIDTTSPVEMVNGKRSYSALMPFGNQLVGRIDAWLQEHPGMHTPSRIARAVKADTHEAYMVLSWLDDRGMFVTGDGNGMRRRYGTKDSRPAA